MTTLQERIEAAVRERMAVAQEAIGEPVDQSVPWAAVYDPPRYEFDTEAGDEWWVRGPNGHTVATCGENYTQARQHAEHIAANDPARILRDCAEDLDVLERHRKRTLRGGQGCSYDGLGWPCAEVCSLARRYGITEDGAT